MKYKVKITKQPRYQEGGSQDAQQQIIEVVKAYAKKSGVDPKSILLQLQKMQPEEQQQALQQMAQEVQGGEQEDQSIMKRGGRVHHKNHSAGNAQQQQIMQIIQAFAQMQGVDPKEIMQELQQMQPQQQQQAIQQMMQAVQQGQQQPQGQQQQGPQEEMMEGPQGHNPQEEQMEPQMAYGGQMGYGLDLGARRLWMNQDSDEDSQVTDSIEEVPRDQANIEAEGGETALIPYKQDGSYLHKKIKGNRHTEGGVPLNVPEGTFIYSDTKKMKLGGPVLKMFGKSEKSTKKFTPAHLAKQYNLDKYRAILNDPKSDPIKVRTAELMIQNFEKKLAQLALVQEGKKGYPQGIPEVAQKYYQQMLAASGQTSEENPEQKQFDNEQLEGQETMKAMYGMGFRYGGGLRRFQGDDDGSEVTDEEKPYIKDLSTSFPKITSSFQNTDNTNGSSYEPHIKYSNNFFYDPGTGKFEEKKSDAEKIGFHNDFGTGRYLNSNTNPNDNNSNDNNSTPISNDYYKVKGYLPEDKKILRNILRQKANKLDIFPWQPNLTYATPETYYVDPSRALAANAEQMNAARQSAAMFAGPQSRYSFNAGQYGKNAADIIGQYAMQNVGLGNTAAQQRAAIQNKQREGDYQGALDMYKGITTTLQQSKNKNDYLDQAYLQAQINASANRAKFNLMNATESDDYYINANNDIVFKTPTARKNYFERKRATANGNITPEFLRSNFPNVQGGDNDYLRAYAMLASKNAAANKNGYSPYGTNSGYAPNTGYDNPFPY